MAFRYQVVSVGMWRGKIKRWNTTFHLSSSTLTSTLQGKMQATGYKAPGDVAGACSGGVASISVYNATGGAPILVTTYFDWQTPSTWVPYTGTVWASVPEGTPLDAAGESALLVVGNMAALSKTGKPVKTRKFFHAVPSRSAASYLDPDVDAATQAAVALQWPFGYLQNPSGVSPASVTVEPWYGNHQRVRGRRKTVAAVAGQSFANGVVVGTAGGAAVTQGAAPFPGQ